MARYYKEKAQAFGDIDKYLSEGQPYDVIVFKIATKYGFGKRIVNERIEQIKKAQRASSAAGDKGGE